jgi:hypothetical protein
MAEDCRFDTPDAVLRGNTVIISPSCPRMGCRMGSAGLQGSVDSSESPPGHCRRRRRGRTVRCEA